VARRPLSFHRRSRRGGRPAEAVGQGRQSVGPGKQSIGQGKQAVGQGKRWSGHRRWVTATAISHGNRDQPRQPRSATATAISHGNRDQPRQPDDGSPGRVWVPAPGREAGWGEQHSAHPPGFGGVLTICAAQRALTHEPPKTAGLGGICPTRPGGQRSTHAPQQRARPRALLGPPTNRREARELQDAPGASASRYADVVPRSTARHRRRPPP
jgi:hypothetical protein